MNITPPFGYKDLKALNRADYVRFSLPDELPPPKLITPLIRSAREHDLYADIVGTC